MTEVKKTRGRPPHQPTAKRREEVEMMVAFGNTEEEIALVIGIGIQVLRRHYAEALATGHIKVGKRIAENLVRQALKDDVKAFPAIKFYMNCRMRWSEYAPAPSDSLGKKEQAQMIAQTAEAGTGWAHLVH